MKLIVFDCDGTLVDSQQMICAAMQQAFAANGLATPARERLLGIVGLSLPNAFRRLGDLEGEGPEHPVEHLVAAYRDAFQKLRQSDDHLEPLYPGARDAIEALAGRAGTLLGIATGKSQRGVRTVLGRHGLYERFCTIQTSDDAPSKPHPEMILAAMRQTGVAPHDTVMIGDTAFDIEMARAAGAHAIGVAWGYHPVAALSEAGAHAIIGTFGELLPALERVWAAAPTAQRIVA